MKRFTLTCLFFVLAVASVLSIPAYPVRKTVKTIDGKTVEVTLRGDENYSYYISDTGIRFQPLQDGRFAPVSEDMDEQALKRANKVRKENDDRRASIRHKAAPLKGSFRGLVILAEFEDVKFTAGKPSVYNDFFNKTGYTDYGMTGSVHDYFLDQSYGQFDLTFDIVGPVQLDKPMAAYGGHVFNDKGEEIDKDADRQGFAVDAVKAAAPLVDFSKYDWDNDGEVDQVFIIYAGYSEAYGASGDCIWPHEFTIYNYNISFNNTRIATYGCSSELRGTSGMVLDGIGSACHEFSHCLGLMDAYDTKGNNYGMGRWSVMASGNYMDEARSPVGYTSYERWLSGWVDPVELNSDTSISDMQSLEETPTAYIIYNDATHNEFYMLENRQPSKWGKGLDVHGLLVLHVDYDEMTWWTNSINAQSGRERYTVVPADNIRSDASLAGDPFPGSKNKHSLTDATTPAATVFNTNVDGTNFMGKPIENITESASGLVSFNFMKGVTGAPSNFRAEFCSETSMKLLWDEVPSAQSYEVTVEEIKGPSDNPEDAIMLYEDFEESCYAEKVNTLNNVASKLDTYLSTPGWTGANLYRGPLGLQMGTKAKQGSIKTPKLDAPYFGKVTAIIALSPVTKGTSVSVAVEVYIDGSYLGKYDLTVKDDFGTVLAGLPDIKESIQYNIVASASVYISAFGVFDGEFEPEDFEVKSALPKEISSVEIASLVNVPHVSRKANEPELKVFTTNTNSLTLENLVPGNAYICRLRAIMSDGKYSRCSLLEATYDEADAITEIPAMPMPSSSDAWFDLSGRKVVAPATHGIYIHNGKKILK